MNLLTFLFHHLSSDLEYFYLEAAGLQKDRRGLNSQNPFAGKKLLDKSKAGGT